MANAVEQSARDGKVAMNRCAKASYVAKQLREKYGIEAWGNEGFKSLAIKICDVLNIPVAITNKNAARMIDCYVEVEKMLSVVDADPPRRTHPVGRSALNGANKKLRSFYASKAWRDLRYRALTMYGAVCACCGASPSTGAVLHVDHIKPRSKFPELEMEIENLQVLCADCNMGKGNRDSISWRTQQANIRGMQR